MDISIDDLFILFPDMKRYKKALTGNGFASTKQLADEYLTSRILYQTHPQIKNCFIRCIDCGGYFFSDYQSLLSKGGQGPAAITSGKL